MSWKSGGGLLTKLILVIKKNVSDVKAKEIIYDKLIEEFENMDCDTVYNCVGIDKVFDNVYYTMYPEEEDEDLE